MPEAAKVAVRPVVRTDAGRHAAGMHFDPQTGGWHCVFALHEPSRTLVLEDEASSCTLEGSARRIGRVEAGRRIAHVLLRRGPAASWAGVRVLSRAAVRTLRGDRSAIGNALMDLYTQPGDASPGLDERAGECRISLLLAWPVRADLHASGDLHVAARRATAPLLEASGDDPQLQVGLQSQQLVLPGGWYHVRADLEVAEGEINSPCLYPDYGSGLDASSQIMLSAPDGAGRISGVVLFKHDVRHLRFDPSIRRARFRVTDMRLRRLTRLGASLRMLASMRSGWQPDMPALRGVLADCAHSLAGHGPRRAGETLYRHYQNYCRPNSGTYESWVRMYDTLTASTLGLMRERAAAIVAPPLVSVLVPVYNTPERWLRRCLDSVLAQVYPHWELCIADDASTSRATREVLLEYARRDARIRVEFRPKNGHIAEASNTSLAMARGAFVALLDHDDELRPHALFEMVQAALASPEARLLFSDEDKIDERGRRFEPYFKPDWNPDLLLAQNYICHLTMIDRALAVSVGGFRRGYEGSQDHDLFLRCTGALSPQAIVHVPKVLYHWRAIAGSTALSRDTKDYAAAAGARAVADHLDRAGVAAVVEQLPHGHYRVRWPVPVPGPRVSLVIPTRDKPALLRTCVDSILSTNRYPLLEVLVVDNQSTDPEALEYLASLAADERVRVLRYDAPFNFSAINNFAVAQARGDVVGLVNNDIEVLSGDWLHEMVGHAMRPQIGAVGAMLRYPDGSIQHAGVVLGVGGIANHPFQHQPRDYPGHGARALVAQNYSAVTAACLLVRRELYVAAGGLDERLAVAFNDVDFCLRLTELGYLNVWTPFVDIVHHESASRGLEDTPEKQARFQGEVDFMQQRWGDLVRRDPHYNPNLTLETVNFELAFPPRD
jgi:glycosyltransferase involved in cell wall biosynthesis